MLRELPLAAALAAIISTSHVFAAEATLPAIEVTTSKLAEPVDQTPAMISVLTGDELRARGVVDLRTALSLVAGVDIAPGGDAGPAVPAFGEQRRGRLDDGAPGVLGVPLPHR